MKKFAFIALLAALSSAQSGRVSKPPDPPERMGPDSTRAPEQQSPKPPRVDMAEIQREADELARTADTIPADVQDVRRGLLPKDVIRKLKEIEKLSKKLRSELNP